MPHTPCPLVQPLPRLVPTPTNRPSWRGQGGRCETAAGAIVMHGREGPVGREKQQCGEPQANPLLRACSIVKQACRRPTPRARSSAAAHLPPPRAPGCSSLGRRRSLPDRGTLRPGRQLPCHPGMRIASPRSKRRGPGRPQCLIRPGCAPSGPVWMRLQGGFRCESRWVSGCIAVPADRNIRIVRNACKLPGLAWKAQDGGSSRIGGSSRPQPPTYRQGQPVRLQRRWHLA